VGYLDEVALEQRYLMHTYGRKPVEFVRGEGMRLFDDAGGSYLDFIAGVGSVGLGHAHPAVTAAIREQAGRLLQVGNYYYVEHRGEVAGEISRLLSTGGADRTVPGADDAPWRTFFANSGAEANEGAIKLARCHGNRHLGGAATVVTALHSFHGRTLATLFATGQPAKQEAFLPAVAGFDYVPLNDVQALRTRLDAGRATAGPQGVCAVLLECIQGEGGVNPCTPEYLAAARELTEERGMLLIIDEVQTGFYRTGRPFAFQHHGVVPDIVTMAKALGNGVPIGAFSARDPLASELGPGDHGSTFGGNALSCAAAYATLMTMRGIDMAGHVEEVGAFLGAGLARLPHVTEVRGRGLMLAAELDGAHAVAVVDEGLHHGLVLNCVSANVLRFLPPLICGIPEAEELLGKLEKILEGID